jgi:hypothetical protein
MTRALSAAFVTVTRIPSPSNGRVRMPASSST